MFVSEREREKLYRQAMNEVRNCSYDGKRIAVRRKRISILSRYS